MYNVFIIIQLQLLLLRTVLRCIHSAIEKLTSQNLTIFTTFLANRVRFFKYLIKIID